MDRWIALLKKDFKELFKKLLAVNIYFWIVLLITLMVAGLLFYIGTANLGANTLLLYGLAAVAFIAGIMAASFVSLASYKIVHEQYGKKAAGLCIKINSHSLTIIA